MSITATLTVSPALHTLRCGAEVLLCGAEVRVRKAGLTQTFRSAVETGVGFDTLPAGHPGWGYDVDAWELILGLDHVRANAIRTEDGLVLWEDPTEGQRIAWYRVREIR